jgi:hypothetical protein
LIRARDRQGGRQHVGRSIRPAHDFQKPHHIGRAEKMHTEHGCGPRGGARDLVHVEIGCVGREDRPRRSHLVERAENLVLDAHFLECSLHHDIGVLCAIHAGRTGEERHALSDIGLAHAAARGGSPVILLDRIEPAFERLRAGLR